MINKKAVNCYSWHLTPKGVFFYALKKIGLNSTFYDQLLQLIMIFKEKVE